MQEKHDIEHIYVCSVILLQITCTVCEVYQKECAESGQDNVGILCVLLHIVAGLLPFISAINPNQTILLLC
jgi:hypothetical protein